MLKKSTVFLILVVLSFFISCKTSQSTNKVDCYTYSIKDTSQIRNFINKFSINNKTISLNEISFCTHNPLVVQQIMYDNFAKWDTLVIGNDYVPLLFWNNIKPFADDTLTCNLIVYSPDDGNSSFMAYDADYKDLLSRDSNYRKKFILYIIDKINSNTKKDESNFYEVYWKERDPERWKQIKKYSSQ